MNVIYFFGASLLLLFAGCTFKPTSGSSAFPKGYFDERYREFIGDEHILESGYTYVLTSSDGSVYTKRTFYPDTKQITSEVHYKSPKFRIKSGAAKYWHEDGDFSSEGQYVNNKKEGV